MVSTQVPTTETATPGTVSCHMADLDRLRRASYQRGLGHLWKRFESRIPDLFVDDPTQSTIGISTAEHIQLQWVPSPNELSAKLEENDSKLLVLNRYNSWSRIGITFEDFCTLCSLAGVTPFFLHFVIGMGRKSSSKDEDFMSCYSTFAAGLHVPEARNESFWSICYNVRHFERHGRDIDDPWSCRQSALHHSFSPDSKQSAWVIIQPPEAFDQAVGSAAHPMSLHLYYIHAALANWREYLDYFAEIFKVLNQQIAMPNPYRVFKINFSHEQRLHNLKGKLHHARNILTNTRNNLDVIARHESAMAEQLGLSLAIHNGFQRELKNIAREVEGYIGTSCKLLFTSDNLKSMYDNILNFHGQELQHDTSLKLAYIVQADATENRDMAVLANLTYRDSQSTRIATAIAMFYLPVNLVMSFFSSTLVWYEAPDDTTEVHSSRLKIRNEVWIASVAAVVLAMGTVCWSWWWGFTAQKKPVKTTP